MSGQRSAGFRWIRAAAAAARPDVPGGRPKLTPRQAVVLQALARYADYDGWAHPSIKTLGEECGYQVRIRERPTGTGVFYACGPVSKALAELGDGWGGKRPFAGLKLVESVPAGQGVTRRRLKLNPLDSPSSASPSEEAAQYGRDRNASPGEETDVAAASLGEEAKTDSASPLGEQNCHRGLSEAGGSPSSAVREETFVGNERATSRPLGWENWSPEQRRAYVVWATGERGVA